MRKLSRIALFFSLFLVLFSFVGYADSVTFNYPLGSETLSNNVTLNVTSDYDCINATFYYSNNASNPWQNFIGNNTTADGRNFTLTFNTNIITDGTYNFTVNVTNSTNNVTFNTITNITIENQPNWYNNTPPPSVEYSPNQTYNFSITWLDDDGLSEVILEFDGENYTYSSGNLSNNSNVYNGSFTDLTSKAFTYRWIANDTYGNSNSTGNLTYTVTKNSSFYVSLTLNDSESNRTYFLNQIANFNASVNINDKTIYLNSSYPSWNNITNSSNFSVSNTTNLTSLGLFFITAYWNAENYTNKTFYFGVTNLSWSDNSTYSDSLNYTKNGNYSFQIKWTGDVSKVIFESDFNGSYVNYTGINITNWNKTISVSNDTVGNYWINFTDLSADTYHYRWLANDTNNVSIFTDQFIYTVNKSQIVSYSFYTSYGSWSIPISTTSISLICKNNSAVSDNSVNFAINGVCSAAGNPANCTFSTPSTEGYVICTCYVLGVSNYSLYLSQNLSYFTSGEVYYPSTPTGSFTLVPSSSSITIEPNLTDWVTFTLKNTYSYNITKINITVSGIDTSWYNLSNTNISVLQKDGGTGTTLLTLKIPEDAERRNYTIIVSASGMGSGSRLTRQTSVKLIIPEIPQNITNITNETESLNTTGIGSQTNQTNVTGLSINLEEIKDYIVLIIASVSIVLIFIFRNEFTDFIRGKKPTAHPEHKAHEEKVIEEQIHKEQKKLHRIVSHVKKKISSLSENRLVIQVKKKEKKEEEKKT
jgi:hypothetical protein